MPYNSKLYVLNASLNKTFPSFHPVICICCLLVGMVTFKQRAGYTLEELFGLARSTNIQQRILALQTLARVITKVCFVLICLRNEM